ncbi:TrkH family potassium uptake protein [Arcanobacterium phocae]|uniref:TrkH family potassium uptake protein n=1 Tax=Arcanobacterium phocae TaxID=131112 RepID=UPI001C0EA353
MNRLRKMRPTYILIFAFLLTIIVGTFLLMLPISVTGQPPWPYPLSTPPHEYGPQFNGGAPFSVAFFTATSATAVTGLAVVDTATYYSPFGQTIIGILIQLGGMGTMTVVTLVAMVLARRLDMRTREVASATVSGTGLGNIRRVIFGVVLLTAVVETSIAAMLLGRFLYLGHAFQRALGEAWFHSISAFNNAGFSLYTDSLVGFATDPWIILPISAAIIIGGLGYPALLAFYSSGIHWWRWPMTTRLVVVGTISLLLTGWVFFALAEWTNPNTLGNQSSSGKVLMAFFASVTPRTAGFNSIDVGSMTDISRVLTDMFMFIGGGPGGTAGGVKITTAFVIGFVVWSEMRGGRAVNVLGLRLPRSAQRQALTVMSLSSMAVMAGTTLLMIQTTANLDQALFEVVSAFSTVGLSTGITATLPESSQLVLITLMIIGRLGPLTIATALALRTTPLTYELPKDRPLIG